MTVSKIWLENKIGELNKWLFENNEKHFQYALKQQNRDYYVNKLIELEENNLNTIKV